VRVYLITFSSGLLLSFASVAWMWPIGGAWFDALLRCYLKLLPLLHQVSFCHLALALLASCAGAKLPH
jgi:hypothetical protein